MYYFTKGFMITQYVNHKIVSMVGILLISTGKYKQFIAPLVDQIIEHFMPRVKKTIHIFTDEFITLPESIYIRQFLIPSYKFPEATLFRYKTFIDVKSELLRCTHLFYLDADMAIVKEIPESLLTKGLVAVRHPGFFMNDGWGDSNNPESSLSYLPKEQRRHYYAGGFQGGHCELFLMMSSILADNIDNDYKRNIIAEHNDETNYNWFLSKCRSIELLELDPEFCMVEQIHLRQAWNIQDLPVSIIALHKNHNEIRS